MGALFPVGSSLVDTDADGMHDPWGQANNFNPIDPADAALDSDGDGMINLFEYRCATDPHAALSVLNCTGLAYRYSGLQSCDTACRSADFQILNPCPGPTRCGLETRDTADSEVCTQDRFVSRSGYGRGADFGLIQENAPVDINWRTSRNGGEANRRYP
ncbi:MAG: hypothetical protein M1608_05445 [Candidatus Omnitrophica bacterium]|nr:hypothetical protein [Candidatus Omnitrophota bacterium]